MVAPYVGAWIETVHTQAVQLGTWSHPTWVRGLKQRRNVTGKHHTGVAPYVGAWIETKYQRARSTASQSHPTWVRGLKHYPQAYEILTFGRTLRGCVD